MAKKQSGKKKKAGSKKGWRNSAAAMDFNFGLNVKPKGGKRKRGAAGGSI